MKRTLHTTFSKPAVIYPTTGISDSDSCSVRVITLLNAVCGSCCSAGAKTHFLPKKCAPFSVQIMAKGLLDQVPSGHLDRCWPETCISDLVNLIK